MEHELKSAQWRELSPAEQARRCRFMASEAQTLAEGASSKLALSYTKIAEEWLKLADEIERNADARRPNSSESPSD